MSEVEETRAVIAPNETYEGKLIPTRRAEIARPVTIHEGATVTGGVYGQDVSIETDATIDGPVMAQTSIEFDGGTVTADVGTPGRVIGEDGTFFGTITATKITLSNCKIYGHVVGQEIRLDECLVFGVVVGERTTELRDTLCFTFKSFGEGVLDGVEVVLPQAVADGSMSLETPVSVLSIPDTLLHEERDGEPDLTEHDLTEYGGTQYLTLAPRLLRLSEVREQIREIEDVFSRVIMSLKAADGSDPERFDKGWLEDQLGKIDASGSNG